MASGDDKFDFEDATEDISRGPYVICPCCKGKGYCAESELSNREMNLVPHTNGITLPVIRSPKRLTTASPTMKQGIKEKFDYRLPSILPDMHTPNVRPTRSMSPLRKPPLSRGKLSDSSDFMADFIGYQDIENPAEFVKVVRARLKATEWNDRIAGLQGAVHLSRVEPDMVVALGRVVCRALLGELVSLRSKCVRVACQAIRELFKLTPFVFRPEFDELVYALLCRAADNKRLIREEADEALATIASYTPVQHVVRAAAKGPRHKHQMVRKSALRVYKIVVSRIGSAHLMKNPNYHDIRHNIIEAGCIFMDDPISDIRTSAKDMMRPLVKMPEFEDIMVQELINSKYYQRVENCLFAMKFEVEQQ